MGYNASGTKIEMLSQNIYEIDVYRPELQGHCFDHTLSGGGY